MIRSLMTIYSRQTRLWWATWTLVRSRLQFKNDIKAHDYSYDKKNLMHLCSTPPLNNVKQFNSDSTYWWIWRSGSWLGSTKFINEQNSIQYTQMDKHKRNVFIQEKKEKLIKIKLDNKLFTNDNKSICIK